MFRYTFSLGMFIETVMETTATSLAAEVCRKYSTLG